VAPLRGRAFSARAESLLHLWRLWTRCPRAEAWKHRRTSASAGRVNDQRRERGSGRLRSTSASAALSRDRNPPPVSRLCRLDPASGVVSPTSLKRLARQAVVTGSSPVRCVAKRRSSTSAIDTIRKHDRRIGGDLACARPRRISSARKAERASPSGCAAELPRVQGPISSDGENRPSRPLPTRLLASEAFPRPDWPGHLMSRNEIALRIWSHSKGPCPARSSRRRTRAPDCSGGAFPTRLREEDSCSAHPRCLPSPGLLVRG